MTCLHLVGDPVPLLSGLRISLVIIFGVFLVYSCDPPGDDRLWLHNRTLDTLYFYKTYTGALPINNPLKPYSYLLPNEKLNLKLGTGRWPQLVMGSSPDSSLTVYTFPKRTVDDEPWVIIKQNKLYTRSKFTLGEIQKLNWVLPIPSE